MSLPTSNPPRPRRALSVSVRELVEFVLRSGDLAGERGFASPSRALEGTRGHQRVQKSRPEGYRTEVPVSHCLEADGFVLEVRGRIDGVMESDAGVMIEEIKSVRAPWNGTPNPLHWAQARIYAFLLFHAMPPRMVELRLTYLELESNQLNEHAQELQWQEIAQFFAEITGRYMEWLERQVQWLGVRDESIGRLEFPYPQFRPGQEGLVARVGSVLTGGGTLLVEAPTGIGKTLSVLHPAVCALGLGKVEKVFYFTATTVGRRSAESALDTMRGGGLRARSLALTARQRICFNEGGECDPRVCPYALGYYDRMREALRELLEHEALTTTVVQDVARRRQVCPHALASDATEWVDVIVGDYNYLFDPDVQLKRFFSEGGPFALLIDEAHNLVDRAREMFSATLQRSDLDGLKESFEMEMPGAAVLLIELVKQLSALARLAKPDADFPAVPSSVLKEQPKELLALVNTILGELEERLARGVESLFGAPLLEGYFRLLGFARVADQYDQAYVTIVEAVPRNPRVRLFCLDPSNRIQKVLRSGKAAVFFSGTLSPVEYFQRILCGPGGGEVIRLDSPFPSENFRVLVMDRIATTFRQREATCGAVARSIRALIQGRVGNYLIFFPSYTYLNRVHDEFLTLKEPVTVALQRPAMSEADRDGFIQKFHEVHHQSLVGFAVMGGLFGEGIDLAGERLVGAVVVGVGLPQVSLERELIRRHFDVDCDAGYEFAYTFPGMNRVLQAAGRVIRSETDRGILLLIDARFGHARYRELAPPWWERRFLKDAGQVLEHAKQFWQME